MASSTSSARSLRAAARQHPLPAEAFGRRVEALAGELEPALDGEPKAVHQARVATRRLREILPVALDTTSGRGARLRRRLKRLTRALGPVRELDVACGLLTDRSGGRPEPGVVALRAHLSERRLAALDVLHRACDAGRARRLLKRLSARVEALAQDGRGAAPPRRERRRLARRVVDRACALAAAVDASGAMLIVDRVHAVRIAAKRLRYALELAGELALAKTQVFVARLKTTQDILGSLHDLDVLRIEAARVHASLPPESIVARDLDRIVAALDGDVRQLHARYLRGARALAALTDRVQDRMAPCLDSSIST